MYNPSIHKRRSIRLKNYDYSSEGSYFITLCTIDRKNIFGQITDGEMHLNILGEIAYNEWRKNTEIRNNILPGEFIIMPNHLHGIINIDYKIKNTNDKNIGKFHSPSQTIGAIIRGYKGATTKQINQIIRNIKEKPNSTGELQFAPNITKNRKSIPIKEFSLSGKGSVWQRNYYEHIIKTEKAYNNISNYIINNPRNWQNN